MKHDPYCPISTDGNWPGVECLCDLISDVEARAVQRVEALPQAISVDKKDVIAAIKGDNDE